MLFGAKELTFCIAIDGLLLCKRPPFTKSGSSYFYASKHEIPYKTNIQTVTKTYRFLEIYRRQNIRSHFFNVRTVNENQKVRDMQKCIATCLVIKQMKR